MNFALLVLGVVVLVAVVVDLLWTTLWVDGSAGPFTMGLMTVTWRALRRVGGENSRLLTISGPLMLVLGLAMWILLLWGGWTLVFAGATNALRDTIDSGPISWYERIYFTGYTIFTMGNGDFAPRDGVWQVVTALATGSGMLFVTLSITYVISVLDAVTQKRSFASGVTGLGMRGDEIVRAGWNGEAFEGLELPLNTFTEQLNTLTSNHRAYPIVHYFHSGQPETAPVVAVAALDEALTMLHFGVTERDRPSEAIVGNARASVKNYLEVLSSSFVEPADRAPPPPDVDAIRDAGVPVAPDREFESSVADLTGRRRLLLGLVESDARQWPSADGE
ncbi:ion channel [Halobacterium zhouii]|uniref:ion channel n=1 Tax=Halobacterium zhouii TaxID=2902624 RepID=UPI003D7A1BBC